MDAQNFAIDDVLERYPKEEPSLVMVLQDIQDKFNYLPRAALDQTAAALDVPLSKVYAVATFYKAFSLKPRGKKIIRVCTGTACHVRGAQQIEDEFTRLLNIKPGQTTPDMKFTLEVVNCIGACAMAPVVVVGDEITGDMKPGNVKTIVEKK